MKSGQCICVYLILAILARACPNEIGCTKCTDPKTGPQTCARCEHSFFDSEMQRCNPYVPSVENCKEFELVDNKITCKSCELGFTVDNGKCSKCVDEDCAMCSVTTDCTACFRGWKFNLNPFRPTRCLKDEKCSVANCDVSSSVNGVDKCFRCDKGFALVEATNECVPAAPECSEAKSAHDPTCIGCHWGYYISSAGVCKVNAKSISTVWMLIILVVIVAAGCTGYTLLKGPNKTREGIYIGV